jgi:pimeloyl-ACP methyl ester carboxylesterase
MLYCTEVLAESRNEDPRESQLWYFGVSYGSLLGMTYASLFPNRVGRIAVDGIVDAEDWYGMKSGTDVLEFDKVLRYFFQICYDAGKFCPFWSNSTSAIEARLNAVMDALKLNPLPANNKYPEITANRLKMVLFRLLYQPVHGFPFLAEYLVDIEK